MSPTISRLELMQEGVVGLLQALQRYDPDRGVPFWAYARHYVRRAMQRLVAELSRPVVLSDHALRNLTRIRDAQRKFAEEHHRDPTLRELAEMTGLDVDQVSHLVTFDRPMRPIPDTMNLDDGSIAVEPPDRLSDGEYERVLDAIEAEELVALLSTLSDRERMILRARYGLDGPEQTRQEIAERLGISTARVKEIERRALGKLAAAARAAGAEA
jgi:RNA polymerase sigma factor (sigma-70 family)